MADDRKAADLSKYNMSSTTPAKTTTRDTTDLSSQFKDTRGSAPKKKGRSSGRT